MSPQPGDIQVQAKVWTCVVILSPDDSIDDDDLRQGILDACEDADVRPAAVLSSFLDDGS